MTESTLLLVKDQTFRDEILTIDNTHYSNCMLIRCTLEYSGGPVAFEHTQMKGCRYVFFGKARRTVHFLQGVGLLDCIANEWAELPTVVQ
ncbi:MAG: hypothetical protein INR62_06660 [Rhodospirillales bacterium]|nr:hypothetical protein [Acetobacter sp.]